MPIFLPQMLLIPLIVMVIPVAILIGQWWRGGPLSSLSGGALLGVGVYVALMWSSPWYSYTDYSINLVALVSLAVGALLLLGAWTLALTDALRMRRWSWAGVASVAVYATFVGSIGFLTSPAIYCASLPSGPPICMSPDYSRLVIFTGFSLAGPLALLAYAQRAQGRNASRTAMLPEGLTVSRLDARAE